MAAACKLSDVPLVFRAFDLDGDGTITREELKGVLKRLDPTAWTDSSAEQLLVAADKNEDGSIQLTEFWSWLSSREDDKVAAIIPKAMAEATAKHAAAAAENEEKKKNQDEARRREELNAQKEAERATGVRVTRKSFVKERVQIGVNKDVAEALFRMADRDGDGDVDKEEFGALMSGETNSAMQVKEIFKRGCAPAGGEALTASTADSKTFRQLLTTFKQWDEDGDGTISATELSRVVRTLNPRIGQRAIDMIVAEADTSGDGVIDLSEFVWWLCGGSAKKKREAEVQQARMCCGIHKERAAQALSLGMRVQGDFELVQHEVLQQYFDRRKIKPPCNTLNHGRDGLRVCENCVTRHIWFCHGCGFISYYESCVNGCPTDTYGWTCISGKCKGKRCGCKKKPEWWQRKGWAMDLEKLHVEVPKIIERARSEGGAAGGASASGGGWAPAVGGRR